MYFFLGYWSIFFIYVQILISGSKKSRASVEFIQYFIIDFASF